MRRSRPRRPSAPRSSSPPPRWPSAGEARGAGGRGSSAAGRRCLLGWARRFRLAGPIRLGPLVLTRPIGQGGMGTVWHARHPEGVDVAVKVLRPEYAAEAELMDTFRQEVRSVASLDHPNIVRVFDYGAVPPEVARASDTQLLPGSPWLAMEFASGGTLADCPPAARWTDVVDFAEQILEGLAHSHARDIIHRDLKPRNVLLHPDDPADGADEQDTQTTRPPVARALRITVTDFGIAHALSRRSADHAHAGTPGYMAPEQIRGEWRDQGPWTDLYALGCLVWRMITGRSPFSGETKRKVLRAQLDGRSDPLKGGFTLPDGADAWLHRLIHPVPTERFPCAADALHALHHLGHADAAKWPEQPDDWRPAYPPTTTRPAGTGLALFLLRPWPLVGRDALQDELWRRLRAVRETGRAQCVVLSGPEGVGKTRLARWIGERAAETGAARVLRAQHDRDGTRTLQTAVRAQLGLTDLDGDEAVARVLDWLGPAAHEEDAAALTQLLDPVVDDPDATRIDDDPDLWFALLDRLTDRRPLVLVVDDLQWSEAAPMLTALVGTDRPVLAVCTLDPAELGAARRLRVERLLEGAAVIDVEPLPTRALRRLVDDGVGVSRRLADSLVERVGGNPAMAVRIVTDWARRGMLVPTTTGFDLRDSADVRLPSSVTAPLEERLDALEEPDRVAIELLATLGGRRIRDEEWAAVCHQAGVAFDEQTRRRLMAAGVARARRERNVVRWTLEPLLLREAAVARAEADGRLRAHHDAAARVLLATRRPSAQERAIVHLVDAGHTGTALRALRTLIDTLDDEPERQASLAATERRLLDALHVPKDDPRRLPSRLAALTRGGGEVSLGELRGLAGSVEASGDAALTARVYRQIVERLGQAHRLRPDDPLLDDALRWLNVADDAAGVLTIRLLRAVAAWRAGDGTAVEELEALRAAVEGQTGPLVARILTALGELRCDAGDATGHDLYEQAAAALDDPQGLAAVELARSRTARRQGDLVTALERARRATRLLVDALCETWPADLEVALCRLARGELTQARTELQAVADTDDPTVSVLAQGALLATLVAPPDWKPWDRTLVAWREHGRGGALVHPDSAWPLEWAAKRAVDAGAFRRGVEAYELAAHQYALVGDAEAMDRVRRRLRALDSAAPQG
ncbi:MAG: protein kinase [Myxococcota bacterium]